MKDSWTNRLQFEIRIVYTMIPTDGWRKWLFDPAFNLVLPNRPWKQGQKRLSSGPAYYTEDNISRYFWLSGSIQILGLDIGAGVFWRKRYDPTTESNTA